ncbi:TetR/AcrR family transcriptional regulator [Lentzea sp. NPDC006480]|uniref:TetR/AcrR family transcriptional regulator n=1 Tax=Lentzea sp. NPDC006480 TaxID=3157176 RepID=UPI0033A39EA6
MAGTRDAKQRVMDATVELIREGGLRAAAPAAIAERAGAGKMSLYRHFGGKDELVAEALRDFLPRQLALLLGDWDDPDPRQRVLGVFDRLARFADKGTLRACVYVSTRLEVADADHPASPLAGEYKDLVTQAFAEAVEELGRKDSEAIGRMIAIQVDGAVVHAIVHGDSRPLKDARRVVEMLLDS